MKKKLAIAAALSAFGSLASADAMNTLQWANLHLHTQLEGCMWQAKLNFVEKRDTGKLAPDSERAQRTCADTGKGVVQKEYQKLKADLGTQKVPEQMDDWRATWEAAFDASTPGSDESEAIYVFRYTVIKGDVVPPTRALARALQSFRAP